MSLEQITQLVTQARNAHQQMRFSHAAALQEEAVTLLRNEPLANLHALGIQLYNLAGYYQDCGQYHKAVEVLKEVVDISEKTGNPDLAQDRATLEQARQLAAMPAAERGELEEEALKYLSLTPEEREAERQTTVEQGLHTVAVQIRDLAIAALAGELNRTETADRIDTSTVRIMYDESLGDGRHELVTFMRATIDLLHGREPRPVPEMYRPYWEEIQAGG